MGLTEFFAMEAGEYLERLDTLVSGAVGPDRDELLRLTRALRGSALMANQQQIGNVAAALESLARAVKEERVPWDEATRQTSIRAVDGLKVLVRSVGQWGDRESAKAEKLAGELAGASGIPVTEPTALDASVDTGTRAFVAREGAAVASVLNQAAKSLQRDGYSASQVESVLRSMEPLRGLAALSELSPLPEYLDGVEQAVVTATRGADQANELALFLDIAARGISKATQEISTTGATEPESMEAREFTRRLAELLDIDTVVVPIQSLYYEDDGPHVIEPGMPPALTGTMGQMELVAHGEHLCQVADALKRAQWDTQREIRTISLKSTLRTLTAAKGSSLTSAVSAFATVAIEALANGFLELHKDNFITQLSEAGQTLSGATYDNEHELVASLTGITETLRTLPQATEPAPSATVSTVSTVPEPPEPAADPVLNMEAEQVPDLAAEQVPDLAAEQVPDLEVVQVPDLESDDRVDIAASWASFEMLRDQHGDVALAIEELVGGVVAETPDMDTTEIVSITELCYSGSAALEQAFFVRDRIRSEMAESEWDAALVTDLIDELLDLVELGVGQT